MYDFDQDENVVEFQNANGTKGINGKVVYDSGKDPVEITKDLFSNSKSDMVFETDNGPKGLFELLDEYGIVYHITENKKAWNCIATWFVNAMLFCIYKLTRFLDKLVNSDELIDSINPSSYQRKNRLDFFSKYKIIDIRFDKLKFCKMYVEKNPETFKDDKCNINEAVYHVLETRSITFNDGDTYVFAIQDIHLHINRTMYYINYFVGVVQIIIFSIMDSDCALNHMGHLTNKFFIRSLAEMVGYYLAAHYIAENNLRDKSMRLDAKIAREKLLDIYAKIWGHELIDVYMDSEDAGHKVEYRNFMTMNVKNNIEDEENRLACIPQEVRDECVRDFMWISKCSSKFKTFFVILCRMCFGSRKFKRTFRNGYFYNSWLGKEWIYYFYLMYNPVKREIDNVLSSES